MNCFHTSMLGPYIEYMRHKNWIEEKGDYQKIPSTLPQMLKWIASLLIFTYLYLFIYKNHLSHEYLLTEDFA